MSDANRQTGKDSDSALKVMNHPCLIPNVRRLLNIVLLNYERVHKKLIDLAVGGVLRAWDRVKGNFRSLSTKSTALEWLL